MLKVSRRGRQFPGRDMAPASFEGLRVLSLESRRATEIAKLIRTYGGEPFVVPAMRETPLESNTQALEFASRLMTGEFDLVVFLTGAGVRMLLSIAETKYDREQFLSVLRKVRVASRGPKPVAVLKELDVPVAVTAPEPNTWREMLTAIEEEFGESLKDFRVAVQEYGVSNPELLEGLADKCREVVKVPVYAWELPEDRQPLREAALGIANGGVDVVMFTTSAQVMHLFQIAVEIKIEEEMRAGLQKVAVASIGPTTTEELVRYGVTPDFEPSHPKMGFLVKETAENARRLLESKRGGERTLGARQSGLRTGENGGDMTSIAFLHEIGSRIAKADSLHKVLDRIVAFVTTVIPADSCFIYVLEGRKLVLRASKNPHAELVDKLGMRVGQGITGWVAEHKEPAAIASNASEDPRFKAFKNLPEDKFEAMLSVPILCTSKVVGVINLQHRLSYQHTASEVQLLSMIGFLVGAEIERVRLESENTELAGRLETRRAVERAKGILQRDLGVTEEEAYRMMQRESRQRRKSMLEIAEVILLGEEIRKGQTSTPSEPVKNAR
jgi:uroporphyrinogen-III synthase